MRATGKITSWNDDRGFGFIAPDAGGREVFVHIKAFTRRQRRPEIGHAVAYDLSTDEQGRPRAAAVVMADDERQSLAKRSASLPSLLVALCFFVIVGLAVLAAKLPPWIVAVYGGASLIAFIMYGLDKSAAGKGAWRTSERTLHMLSLVGGWPGALVARHKFRHKTKKASFRFVFWVTVVLNCGALAWLATPAGAATTVQALLTRWLQSLLH